MTTRTQVALFLMGVAIIAIPHATSFSGIIGIVMVLGFCDGCVVSLIMPIVYDLVGPHGAPQGIGTQMGLCALPMVAGPPLAGRWRRSIMFVTQKCWLV